MVKWSEWSPGLDNEENRLGEVYETAPIAGFSPYPFIVQVFENPKSPLALKEHCQTKRHDCIHVLLGRGFFVQDEAFVIGYSMGTSKTIGGFAKEYFKFCVTNLYPRQYKFTEKDVLIYDLGFFAGQQNKINLFNMNIEDMLEQPLGELRKKLNIDVLLLKKLYDIEKKIVDTKASRRLPGL